MVAVGAYGGPRGKLSFDEFKKHGFCVLQIVARTKASDTKSMILVALIGILIVRNIIIPT